MTPEQTTDQLPMLRSEQGLRDALAYTMFLWEGKKISFVTNAARVGGDAPPLQL